MIRIVLAVLAGLLCGAAGMGRAGEIRWKGARLKRWQEILEHMQLLMEQGTLPLPEVLLQCANEDAQPDALLRKLAKAMADTPMAPIQEHWARMEEDGEEAGVLRRMMGGLSSGTLESRVLAVAQALREMQWMASAAHEKEKNDARMWATLGWTCGACLTILLL